MKTLRFSGGENGTTDNACTVEEVKAAIGFVVCHDTFMSGWGGAKDGRSFYALAILEQDQIETVIDNAHARSEMKRPRFTQELPELGRNDHLKIVGPSKASRWYEPGGFSKD